MPFFSLSKAQLQSNSLSSPVPVLNSLLSLVTLSPSPTCPQVRHEAKCSSLSATPCCLCLCFVSLKASLHIFSPYRCPFCLPLHLFSFLCIFPCASPSCSHPFLNISKHRWHLPLWGAEVLAGSSSSLHRVVHSLLCYHNRLCYLCPIHLWELPQSSSALLL